MPAALVLTGHGPYADPWHPFAETSPALAQSATENGLAPVSRTDIDAALAELRTGPLPALAIANLGRPDDGATLSADAEAGLQRLLAEIPLLALHAAANAFPDVPAWEERLGGRWIPDASWHPPFGRFVAQRVGALPADASPGTDLPPQITVDDERYLDLRLAADRRDLYTHPGEEGAHAPTIWVRGARSDAPRTAYDALGHDLRCYDSTEHRQVLTALIAWLTGAPRPAEDSDS